MACFDDELAFAPFNLLGALPIVGEPLIGVSGIVRANEGRLEEERLLEEVMFELATEPSRERDTLKS